MSLFATIAGFVTGLFEPATNLIDKVVTTDKEKMQLKNELAKIQSEVETKLIELEKSRIEAMKQVEVAEAGSTHWLRANWRPIVSLTLVAIIVLDGFQLIKSNPEVYKLAEIFLGVYAGSRTIDKVAGVLKDRK
jgi:hypothetical protein